MSDLKTENLPILGGVIFCAFVPIFLFEDWSEILNSEIVPLLEVGLIALVSALSVIFSNLVGRELKFLLVFWSRRKPAYHSKKLCLSDSRLDLGKLAERWPEVFSEQNDLDVTESIWYSKVYYPVRDNPAVKSANKMFLVTRDLYISWLIFIVAILVTFVLRKIGFIDFSFSTETVSYSLVVLMILNLTARNTGKNLVLNSVAIAINEAI
ncbi:hypothetical protein BIT28_07575 [Photobacterium proteolyticum]|uniref:Uncharacterized protein n=1 Tax=Photobacterium proteolyticum TaxID=1903952 RepID=A0A1Q9G6H6_9GAMM|nr:hypothetical protein [Photobacterium proteolyticum]OLQ69831.1 hypothetical protein BIT28_07575 [Photobacterium proteolyticum]